MIIESFNNNRIITNNRIIIIGGAQTPRTHRTRAQRPWSVASHGEPRPVGTRGHPRGRGHCGDRSQRCLIPTPKPQFLTAKKSPFLGSNAAFLAQNYNFWRQLRFPGAATTAQGPYLPPKATKSHHSLETPVPPRVYFDVLIVFCYFY